MVCTNKWLSTMRNQLTRIRIQWQPKWKVVSYQRYKYNDNLSERLPVINDTSIMTTWVKDYQLSTIQPTWVKDYQLSTIQVQWQPEWKIASYQQYKYNDDLSEKLPVINDMTDLSKSLPVINNTTNLKEGLLIINDTSAKIICVVILSINALITYMVDNLCACHFN